MDSEKSALPFLCDWAIAVLDQEKLLFQILAIYLDLKPGKEMPS